MATTTPRTPKRPTTRAGRKAAVGKRPPGAPSAIDRPLTLADGTTTTVGENVIRLIATLGTYAERAAAASGVNKAALYGWLERAAKARSKIALGLVDDLTPHDYRCVEFGNAVEVAEAAWEMCSLAALDRIANGTINLTTVTERYGIGPDGEQTLLETQTKVTGLAPNAHVIMWRLTRKFPERYQVRHDPGAAGAVGEVGGQPIDLSPAKVAELVADVEQFAREFSEG